jgi:hypothetical protein
MVVVWMATLTARIAVLAAAVLISACVNAPVKDGTPRLGEAAPGGPKPALSITGDYLDTKGFADLPPEARTYLAAISRAFRSQDKEFLLAQGEKTFEAEVKPWYDDESYLAMLYRSGHYAVDAPSEKSRMSRLEPAAIRDIEYIDWEERGPMIEIRGRLAYKDGSTVPCKIILVWKLTEPKVLGIYP